MACVTDSDTLYGGYRIASVLWTWSGLGEPKNKEVLVSLETLTRVLILGGGGHDSGEYNRTSA